MTPRQVKPRQVPARQKERQTNWRNSANLEYQFQLVFDEWYNRKVEKSRERRAQEPTYVFGRLDHLAAIAARKYPASLHRDVLTHLKKEDLEQYDNLLGELRLTLKVEMERHRRAAAREMTGFEEALIIRFVGKLALAKLSLARRVRWDAPRQWLINSAKDQLQPILGDLV